MPEYRELIASTMAITRWLEDMKSTDKPLTLQKIWADPTKAERKNCRIARGRQGHVVELTAATAYKRGSKGAQQRIYPPWPFSGKGEILPLSNLVLESAERTPRSIVLNFGQMHFQLHPQTHTMAQVYTRNQWDEEICKVPEERRGFKVGMAFDFGHHVLAFPTIDKIFTPHWAGSKTDLPMQHTDVYTDFTGFLQGVVVWMKERWESPRVSMSGLAVNAVRDADTVFGGMGVYSVVEVFFLAGLSVFLTEYEVFRCPSRIARLCEAFWTFAHQGHEEMESLLKPCWRGYVLAADKGQRLRYANCLRVYGKERTNVSLRMKDLHSDYLTVLGKYADIEDVYVRRDDCAELYDVFEPALLEAALKKDVQLGHLIFGMQDWVQLSGVPSPVNCCTSCDPLTAGLSGLALNLYRTTHLRPEFYSSVFLPCSADLHKAFIPTYLYRGDGQKVLWTICPDIPASLTASFKDEGTESAPIEPYLYLVPDVQKKKETFHHIVTETVMAARGPLEYCGVARLIKRQGPGKKEPIVSVCRDSEEVPETYRNRELAGLQRIGKNRTGKGKRKRTDTNSYQRGGWQPKSVAENTVPVAPEAEDDDTEAMDKPLKKQRRSADLKMALQGLVAEHARSSRRNVTALVAEDRHTVQSATVVVLSPNV